MRLLLLLDKKPGHAHQTKGVALALGRATAVETTEIALRPRWFAHDLLRRAALKRAPASAAALLLRVLFAVDTKRVTRPDAIIASGRPTLIAGALLKRHFGVPFIYSGFAHRMAAGDMDLMLSPAPGLVSPVPQAIVPIAGLVHAGSLPAPRPIRNVDDLRGAKVGFLVGGTAHTHAFTNDEWAALIRLIEGLERDVGCRIAVTTSRRTPPEAADLFSGWAESGPYRDFIDYRKGGGGADAIFSADALLVTDDSLSMLSEGLNAGRRVISLRPAAVRPSLADDVVAHMAGEGSLAVMPIAEASAEAVAARLAALPPPPADRQRAIADAVLAILRA